ncbi:MAG: histidinol dehydrogenase [Alphaproteobacteria bacterium]
MSPDPIRPLTLATSDPAFDDALTAFMATKRDHDADVSATVAEIIAEVRARGDEAVAAFTARFDGFDPSEKGLSVPASAMDEALEACPEEVRKALTIAAGRIRAYHEHQYPEDFRMTDGSGVELGHRWTPVDAVGIYVPGGKAAYPSSLLMNAVPARVAGVERVVMTVPTPGGTLNPVILAAAAIAGVTEIHTIGGAQAVAALAYGTKNIRPVDQIVGPGNAYVSTAKRQVFGQVGIDLLAGPSEIVVVADRDNDPVWIAIDLLSQAEHDEAARSVLVTDDAEFAQAVLAAVDEHLASLPRGPVASASWRDHGAVILVRDMDEAADVVNRLAPEHLEIATADPDALAERIRHAGAIFLGRHTPEAIGDYVAGTNHVLPTGGAARFASGLSVLDFMKRTSLVRCSPDALQAIGPAAVTLATEEGLGAHARSVAIRFSQ